MKKVMLIAFATVALTSCSKKNPDAPDSAETKVEVTNTCGCTELALPEETAIFISPDPLDTDWKDIKKDGKLFTGTCIEKDQNDSILKQIEFKNGWTVKKLVREKIGSGYATITNMTYDNLNPINGYISQLATDEDIKYTNILIFMKNGVKDEKESYEVYIKKSSVIGINQRANADGDFIYDSLDGLHLNISAKQLSNIPACLKLLKKIEHATDNQEYYIEGGSVEQRDELVNCFKQHLNKFDYWKIN